MNKLFYLFAFLLVLISCDSKKTQVDLILHNAVIYTLDSAFSIHEAMAIKDGKIIETGTNEFIKNKYHSKKQTNANGKFVFPGFIDAHCHFYGYGKGLNELNLVGTTSFDDVLEKTENFYKTNFANNDLKLKQNLDETTWLIGRGWDQNDWQTKEFPSKEKLDSLFPNIPVILKRIDGHAAIVNQFALTLARFNLSTKLKGGELLIKNNKLSGVLIDNAVDAIENLIPKENKITIEKALLNAQKNCIAMGITTVADAGLSKSTIDVIDHLQKNNKLNIRVYAMLTPNEENLNYYLKHGIYKTDKLTVCSFKFYGDGALGSRGACLCDAYADKTNWKGFLLNDISYFEKNAKLMAKHGFQMNTHCIGDSAATVILNIYKKHIDERKDMRWRIEHAQVVKESNFPFFSKNILPSVQPTHATSDMYWAEKRLGKERVKNAYAYKKLLNYSKIMPLGTDFPVEDISPFKTFYAAVARKDDKGFPANGFQMENALSRKETIKGMTIWAAYANFEDNEKGSLEKGKYADFVIIDTDIMTCKTSHILKAKVLKTYINGQTAYHLN